MKAKKWLTIITFIYAVLGLLFCLISSHSNFKLGYDLSLAIFGSALLGFVMSLAEYFVERRKAMERFWRESYHVLNKFRILEPVCINEPEELLLASFAEEERNKRIDDCRRKVRKSLGLKKRHDSRKRLIAWMKENTSMTLVRSDDSNSILNKFYDDHMKTEYESFEKAIKSYVIFSDIKIYDLDEAYGNLDFLFGNRKIRQAAYDEILNKIRSIRNSVLEYASYFRSYSEGKGSFEVCVVKIIKLNRELFEFKKNETRWVYSFTCISETL